MPKEGDEWTAWCMSPGCVPCLGSTIRKQGRGLAPGILLQKPRKDGMSGKETAERIELRKPGHRGGLSLLDNARRRKMAEGVVRPQACYYLGYL